MNPYGALIRRIRRAARNGAGLRLTPEDAGRLAAMLDTLDAATEAAHYDALEPAQSKRSS